MVPDPNGCRPKPSFPPITPVIPAPSSRESEYHGHRGVSFSNQAASESDGIHAPSTIGTPDFSFPSHFNDTDIFWSYQDSH
jgi:hypothetical protein